TLQSSPGVTQQSLPVTICGDDRNEANETYRVTLSSPVNATISTSAANGTITDNDPQPTLSINDRTCTEGNAGVVNCGFTLSLSAATGQGVSVPFTVAGGTATGGAACD